MTNERALTDIPDDLTLSWALDERLGADLDAPISWPHKVSPEWAWGGSAGKGVRVCVVDSGIDPTHPAVGEVAESWAVELSPDGRTRVVPDTEGDLCGHGTAVAGIIRSLAPECTLVSMRVLGLGYFGSARALQTGLHWAVNNTDVINLSLSTTRSDVVPVLSRISTTAYFRRKVIVASAHNTRVSSFPWRFASVISVGSHQEPDPDLVLYNPEPPVEFFARGCDVQVPWLHGATVTCTGNSFAAPHVTGRCARILSAHPGMDTHLVKSVLQLTAPNVRTDA